MKKLLLVMALSSAGLANAQVSRWAEVLRTDPYLSNGYFIVNPAKYQALGLHHINIDMVLATPNAAGGITKQTIQSFSITNGFQGHADMGFLQTLQPDQTVTYRLRGYTATGSVPIDILAEEVGGGPAWPRVCGQTCNSTNYAWNIAVYALGGQAMMGLQDASTNGSYNYFYVKSSNWNQFTLQYGISDFGMLGGNSWPQILLQSPTEVHWVPSSTTAFKNENGIAFESGYTGPAYAVAKHKWPWNTQGVETDILINNTDVWCGTQDVIRSVFNADDAVQAALATNNPNTVICNAIPSGGGSISWGGSFTQCTSTTQLIEMVDNSGNIDVMAWVEEMVNCVTGTNGSYLWNDVLSVAIDPIDPTATASGNHVLQVQIDGVTDPRLVKVPKTVVQPGLYEAKVILKNGEVLRHFEAFTSPVVFNSRFASFVDVNVYPVPITGKRFAVDFELLYPMMMSMTILDNVGNTKYTANYQYAQPGRHKEVVEMQPLWNNGLYHAVIQYPDGSTETVHFSVQH